MNDPQNEFQLVQAIWTGAITVAGGIVAFFTKRLVDAVDQKANRSEVDALKADFKELLARQDRHHESNVQRLDQILMEISARRRIHRGQD